MKNLGIVKVNAGSREVEVNLFDLEEGDKIENLSRVYVIALDGDQKVPLIYNSKRDIWGFPGGHIEKDESFKESALRECIEEIKRTINTCKKKFLLVNKIDGEKEENQVVCFAKLGKKCENYKDENESVTNVKYFNTDEIISKIGNEELWNPIINSLKEDIRK